MGYNLGTSAPIHSDQEIQEKGSAVISKQQTLLESGGMSASVLMRDLGSKCSSQFIS